MYARLRHRLSITRSHLQGVLNGPQILVYLPALVLVGFWIGGEALLVIIALGFPACLGVLGLLDFGRHRLKNPGGSQTAGNDFRALAAGLDNVLFRARKRSQKTACVLVELDDFDALLDRHGLEAAECVAARTEKRLIAAVRSRDSVFRLGGAKFGIAVGPVRHLDLDVGLQLAGRMQAAVEEPIAMGKTTVYVSACVGFGLDIHIGNGAGKALLEAANSALAEAQRHGPSSIRAYSTGLRDLKISKHAVLDGLEGALENGQIQPWFQPQISTDTGQITGFEALARWSHPTLGIITPPDFLPALEQAGKLERLGEVILSAALTAIRAWDAQGLNVPQVGVNFTPDELRNPGLVDKIGWELDRFELPASRLSVEILENVVATSPDDMVSRNISGLSEMGCHIDLDDFGTGHASISSLRRFAIQRLKIDRSFVMKIDQDPEQKRMVSAILLMAEKLGLDTLAEGVETAGEHAMLAQLGCGHVQGFGIGRPMPFDKTGDWIITHMSKVSEPPVIGRATG